MAKPNKKRAAKKAKLLRENPPAQNNQPQKTNDLVRIRLTGHLTSGSPLHIGTGTLLEKNTDELSLSTLAFMRDKDGLPYIPGSTLRGLLRHHAKISWGEDSELFVRLFGLGKTKKGSKEKSQMGALRVLDAHILLPKQQPESAIATIKDKKISAQPRISIDPITQTAKEHHLFALETLGENTAFSITIELEALGKDLLSMQDMSEIEWLLQTLSSTKNLQLGKGKSIGQGLFTWQNNEGRLAYRISQKDLIAWLTQTAIKPFDSLWKKESLSGSQFNHDSDWLILPFQIYPQSAFLINSRINKQAKGEDEPAAVFQKSQDGRALIPSSSLKGAFRAHCRKILHTIKQSNDPNDEVIDSLINLLFGQTDQAGAMRLHAAKSGENAPLRTHKQYFNAIDRFTGGVKDTALYHVEAAYCAKLDGTLHIKQAFFKQNPWAQALLVMLMRDAIEGDLTFGWGKAKGFGQTEFAWQLPVSEKQQKTKVKNTKASHKANHSADSKDHTLIHSWSQLCDTWPNIDVLTCDIPFIELPQALFKALDPSQENTLLSDTPNHAKEDV